MVELQEIFNIRSGHSLDLNKLKITNKHDGIAYISRKSDENGLSAYVKRIDDIEPGKPGELTCALSGNGVLSTFLQERNFYTSSHVALLDAKYTLSVNQKLFYCYCILQNRFRYSWGRQANKSINTLLVPSIEEIPTWIRGIEIEDFSDFKNPLVSSNVANLSTNNWRWYNYDEIFIIKKGYYNKKPPSSTDKQGIPFIGATEKNNGITSYINIDDIMNYSKTGTLEINVSKENKIFEGNCITVSNNGSVGEAFYQDNVFTCSHDINPLYLKNYDLNKYIAMFLCTLIRLERFRWAYGRKWRPIRMPKSKIKLPITVSGIPDWDFMENYIKSLPYSNSL